MSVRTRAAAVAAFASIAITAAAHAGVTFTPYGTALPTGETTITDFATLAGATGSAGLFTGSQGGVSAAPAFSATTFDTASYLSVQGGESETLSLPASEEISVYLGSLDSYNTLAFGGPGGVTYTGVDLANLTGAVDGGGQVAGSSNGRFVFDFAAPVTSVTFSSTTNALEVASVASVAGGVPEPAAWSLMLVGFFGMGMALRGQGLRRRSGLA
jgi:hypothetical protein